VNLAIGPGLFRQHQAALDLKLVECELRVEQIESRNIMAYPLTGVTLVFKCCRND